MSDTKKTIAHLLKQGVIWVNSGKRIMISTALKAFCIEMKSIIVSTSPPCPEKNSLEALLVEYSPWNSGKHSYITSRYMD